ncbi:MAG: amino acid ABC transporter substrate-binding protein [Leptolinea sp.]|nr:amino acid ABC transporter substrate-binding protein [Leptolinea sp.]
MKKNEWMICLITFSLFLLGCVAPTREKEGTTPVNTMESSSEVHPVVRLAAGEWVPYTGETLPGYGCDAQIVTEVFARMGFAVEIEFFPWARAMTLARNGEYDGTLEWDDTPDWREFFYINSEPISPQEWVFFHRKDDLFEWTTLKDLTGKRIGVTSGYIYSNAFSHLTNNESLRFEEASSDEANLKKLLAGRIDIFPMERNVGLSLLQKNFPPDEAAQLTYHSQSLAVFEPYLLLTRTNPENDLLIARFDETFINFRKESGYQQILDECQQ